MIGLGVNFRVPALTNEYEFQIFDQMYNKMDDICNFYEMEVTDANVYHWGTIEQTILDRIYKKYEDRHDWEPLCLVDFNRIFQDEIILVKGVYSFGLKAVGKGLIKHELIVIPDWDPDVSDGLDAMIQAYKVYNEPEEDHEDIIKKLIKYNHTDVRMIEKIINYLRLNHTPGIVRGATNSLNNFINNLIS